MRKSILALLCALLLTGCGNKGETLLREWQQGIAGAEVSFTAQVTALVGDGEWSYTAQVRSDAEETTVTLTEPEELRGLTFRCGEDASLEYDGAILALPALTASGETPAAALPALCRALRGGRLLRCAAVGRGWEAEWGAEGGERVLVELDETLCPVSAALIAEGRSVVTMEIGGFAPEGK